MDPLPRWFCHTLPLDADAKTNIIIMHWGSSMVVLLKVLSTFSSRNVNLTKLKVINNEGEAGSPLVVILDTSSYGAPMLCAFPDVLYVDCKGAAQDPVALTPSRRSIGSSSLCACLHATPSTHL
jgi:hypothetical protein